MSDENALKGTRITVLGAGMSGVSIARLARRLGASVFVSDSSKISGGAAESLEANGIKYEQGGHTDEAARADKVVVSSGFPPRAPVLEKIALAGVRVTGELDFVLPYIKGKVIGITGTNGKTTTTSLLGHLINAAGARCVVAGNIGSPLADFAGEDCEYMALELSSFQLHWAESVSLRGAIITNLAPDHIDWHGSYEHYAAAKARILNFAGADGFGIVQHRDLEVLGAPWVSIYPLSWIDNWRTGRNGREITLSASNRVAELDGSTLFSFDETNLMGDHNMENAAMALAVVKLLGLDTAKARESLRLYAPPPHRCKLVLDFGGVRYIDDSKGTNIAASSAAMSSIDGPHIVILGGQGKGEDYSNLAEPLKRFAKRALLIGEASEEIAAALEKCGYVNFTEVGDMESAVKMAALEARPGDCVLLSPACTSWDAYKNYHERGEHFVSLVMKYSGFA